MIPVEIVPGIRGGGIRERNGGGNSSMVYLYLIPYKTFVNATMYPHAAQQ
jgi:hypothetical protein